MPSGRSPAEGRPDAPDRPRPLGDAGLSILSIASLLTLLLLTLVAVATPSHAFKTRLNRHDLRTLDADWAAELASYPVEARDAAGVVAGYPEELIRVGEIQRESARRFQEAIDPLPRSEQEQVWTLVRHPGLVADLARDGRKSGRELEAITERHPSEAHAGILELGERLYPTWVRIYAIELDVERRLDALLSGADERTRAAFEASIERPDLISLLLADLEATTLLGAVARENPEAVAEHFDALHASVVARRAEEEQAWSTALEDPETAAEAQAAARAFANEYGYDLDASRAYAGRSTTIVHVNVSPFPFWFGYPAWYDVAYWYPHTVWTHLGFYVGSPHLRPFPRHRFVGLPSPLFLGWYARHYDRPHRLGSVHRFRSKYRTRHDRDDWLRARSRQTIYERQGHRRLEHRSRFESRPPDRDRDERGRAAWRWSRDERDRRDHDGRPGDRDRLDRKEGREQRDRFDRKEGRDQRDRFDRKEGRDPRNRQDRDPRREQRDRFDRDERRDRRDRSDRAGRERDARHDERDRLDRDRAGGKWDADRMRETRRLNVPARPARPRPDVASPPPRDRQRPEPRRNGLTTVRRDARPAAHTAPRPPDRRTGRAPGLIAAHERSTRDAVRAARAGQAGVRERPPPSRSQQTGPSKARRQAERAQRRNERTR